MHVLPMRIVTVASCDRCNSEVTELSLNHTGAVCYQCAANEAEEACLKKWGNLIRLDRHARVMRGADLLMWEVANG